MFDPDNQDDRLQFLFNYFAGSVHRGPWTLQKSPQYHMDNFGNSILTGETCLVRNSAGKKPRRLSLTSALRIYELLIIDNDRQAEFFDAMRLAERDILRDESEGELESYEDERDEGDEADERVEGDEG